MKNNTLLVIIGATASGKTKLAIKLAQQYQGEILSADSRQVYRGLDIGSGKDLHEYKNTPYHLIDIVDPGYEFNVFEYQKAFTDAFHDVTDRHKLPLLVGGTGLYLDSVLSRYQFTEAPINNKLRSELECKTDEDLTSILKNLNPGLHNTTDLLHRNRILRAIEIAQATKIPQQPSLELPQINPLILGIKWERSPLRERIRERLLQRLDEGMIEEVEALHSEGVSWETLHFYGLEYRFVASYLKGELNRNDMFQKLNASIYQFAKQQEKWFRRFESKGMEIHWLNGDKQPFKQAQTLIDVFLQRAGQEKGTPS